jgi:hypothetical protein
MAYANNRNSSQENHLPEKIGLRGQNAHSPGRRYLHVVATSLPVTQRLWIRSPPLALCDRYIFGQWFLINIKGTMWVLKKQIDHFLAECIFLREAHFCPENVDQFTVFGRYCVSSSNCCMDHSIIRQMSYAGVFGFFRCHMLGEYNGLEKIMSCSILAIVQPLSLTLYVCFDEDLAERNVWDMLIVEKRAYTD